MCGIAGIVGNAHPARINAMTQAMVHRGPDDGAVWIDPEADVALGHLRLSIIDLSAAGRQPMISPDGRYVLTYNGEIFNFKQLRRELEAKGYRFASATDTEVLLHGYAEWGKGVLQRIEGQFAFAIWDRAEQRLFAARDHLGIKPLVFSHTARQFLFASEAKALLRANPELAAPAYENLAPYLAFLWVPHPQSFFREVRKVPPGHYLEYRNGSVEVVQYWDVPVPKPSEMRPIEPGELHDLVAKAAREQLVADVPLGLLLSGGLDSTALLECVTGAEKPVHAFTAVYDEVHRKGDVFEDDQRFAELTAKAFRVPLDELHLKPDVVRDLPTVIYHLDEPMADPTVIVNYLITAEASHTARVLLSGMGADEIFGGYPWHAATLATSGLPAPVPGLLRGVGTLLGRVPLADTSLGGRSRRFKLLARHAGKPLKEQLLGYSTYFSDTDQEALFQPEVRRLQDPNLYAAQERCFEHAETTSPLQQLLYVDLKLFLPCLNLENTDKTSMANSVEMRVPFLDRRLVERVAYVPDAQKIRGLRRKLALRQAFEGRIPEEVRKRRKTGFGPPVRGWVRSDLQIYVNDILQSRSFRERGIFRPDAVRKLIEDNDAGREDNAVKIWQLLVLELWHRVFIDGEVRSEPAEVLPIVDAPQAA
jgi:asparagine synthase (glutamine-hydrolysing)